MSTESAGRLVSLDVFRGVTIAAMILVNNPGSWSYVYAPLRHAEWHGWTPTDLIFPFFLFIVGVSMSLSFSASGALEAASQAPIVRRIARRAAVLVGLGLFMAAFPLFPLSTLRFPGVLQRIGVCYLVASLVVLNTQKKERWMFTGGLLVFYWALMIGVPVPGFGAGDLSTDGNLASYLDRWIFGAHTWKPNYDPEGLLSTVPAIATTLIGYEVGERIRIYRSELVGVSAGLFAYGWLFIVGGLVWSIWFPINKALWTSSYVLFTAGAAMELLALCFWAVETKGFKLGVEPAVVFGRNAIAVFFLSGLTAKALSVWKVSLDGERVSLYEWIYQAGFASWAGAQTGSLAFAFATVSVWWLAMRALHRRGIHIKV